MLAQVAKIRQPLGRLSGLWKLLPIFAPTQPQPIRVRKERLDGLDLAHFQNGTRDSELLYSFGQQGNVMERNAMLSEVLHGFRGDRVFSLQFPLIEHWFE